MQSAPAVALHDVTVLYGARPALSNVTVSFPCGATGLLGPNGAGKSTLILRILGLVKPDGGRIEVLGTDVAASPLAVRARIGYMPERDALIPGLNAISAVAYCSELSGLPPDAAFQRAHDVLSYVGLDEGRYRDVETFSTGMKQRLKLAQALVHDPDLLLLDEPTNGMDPKGRDAMLSLISDLRKRMNLSLIFSSHLLADIERTCDAAVVLNHGVVAVAGLLHALKNCRNHIYEVRIKGDHGAFVRALKAVHIECRAGDDELLTVSVAGGSPQLIFAVASRLGVQVRHLRPQLPTLEDVFVQATAGSPTGDGAPWTQ